MLGTVAFDYDYDPARLTTHMPDAFTRITANAGIAGSTLNGLPSNLEPRLVTEGGAPAMFGPNGGDADGQRLLSSGLASDYAFMHQAGLRSIYFLTKPVNNSGGDDYLMSTLENGVGTGFVVVRGISEHFTVRLYDAGSIFVNFGEGISQGFADDTPYFMGTHLAADGDWYITRNGVIMSSYTPTGAYPAADPDHPLTIGSLRATSPVTYGGYQWRNLCYTGVDHIASGLYSRLYTLVKASYPSLGLP